MTIKQTKAERIFNQNFYSAIRHIETWGMEDFDAWNTLYTKEDDELICRRTVNAILAICDKEERKIEWTVKHGYETWKDEAIIRKALSVVRNTCNNWIKDEEVWKAYLKAI